MGEQARYLGCLTHASIFIREMYAPSSIFHTYIQKEVTHVNDMYTSCLMPSIVSKGSEAMLSISILDFRDCPLCASTRHPMKSILSRRLALVPDACLGVFHALGCDFSDVCFAVAVKQRSEV